MEAWMKVLLVGNGGREHAIAWKLSLSKKIDKIYACTINGGLSPLVENLNIDIKNQQVVVHAVRELAIDMVVIGPEEPLVSGLADALIATGVKVFGPNKVAAQFEASKAFSKKFMQKYDLPTAGYEEFDDYQKAYTYLVANQNYPIVLKADGLAAGKGVIIAENKEQALQGLSQIMKERAFGSAGDKLVVEEFLVGEEASVLAFVDNKSIVPMVAVQDHKAIFDNDKGPNTGGMGTYAPAPVVTEDISKIIKEEILDKFMLGLKQEGILYQGVIFIGIMITQDGPKVLEFNVRFGDPETQVIMSLLKTDLAEIMGAVCENRLREIKIEWDNAYAVCVVVASNGYPDKYPVNLPIDLSRVKNAYVFQAGTILKDNKLLNCGGRVLGVTAVDKNLKEAIKKAYHAVDSIDFSAKYFRKDIAQKAFKHLK